MTTDQSAFSILSTELRRIEQSSIRNSALFGNRVVRLLKTRATRHVTLAIFSRDKIARENCRCGIGLNVVPRSENRHCLKVKDQHHKVNIALSLCVCHWRSNFKLKFGVQVLRIIPQIRVAVLRSRGQGQGHPASHS